MAELTTGTLIKLIIGILVVVVVIVGIAAFFGAKVISFFKNIFITEPSAWLFLLK